MHIYREREIHVYIGKVKVSGLNFASSLPEILALSFVKHNKCFLSHRDGDAVRCLDTTCWRSYNKVARSAHLCPWGWPSEDQHLPWTVTQGDLHSFSVSSLDLGNAGKGIFFFLYAYLSISIYVHRPCYSVPISMNTSLQNIPVLKHL